MALSNAERQKRYRQKLKASAQHGWSEELRNLYVLWKPDMEGEGREYSPLDFIADLVEGDIPEARDVLVPILCEMMGLSRDPWPGLTSDALAHLTKGMSRIEVKRRRINTWSLPSDAELDAYDKLKAAQSKPWMVD